MLLALDTSSRYVGIALYDGAQVLSETIWVSQNYHTVELAPAVASIMEKSGVVPNRLKAIAVAIGPGSFTGLRIGLGLAKGIAFVHRIPIMGIPTLDILATSQAFRQEPMAALVLVGRGRFATGWYRVVDGNWQSDNKIDILTMDGLAEQITEPVYVCGELSRDDRQILVGKGKNISLASPAQCVRRPSYLAELGWQRLKKGLVDQPDNLAPLYLRHNDSIPVG
jgi:tRNA threonylcarbamoyladenosine biosynthesis protein TsaB